MIRTSLLVPCIAIGTALSINAQTWTESGEAGNLPAPAQTPAGAFTIDGLGGAFVDGALDEALDLVVLALGDERADDAGLVPRPRVGRTRAGAGTCGSRRASVFPVPPPRFGRPAVPRPPVEPRGPRRFRQA